MAAVADLRAKPAGAATRPRLEDNECRLHRLEGFCTLLLKWKPGKGKSPRDRNNNATTTPWQGSEREQK